MDVAQSELDIYLSTEKKEKNVLDSMKEQLEKASQNYTERHRNLQELESNNPKWAKSLSDKQAELQKVSLRVIHADFRLVLVTFVSFYQRSLTKIKRKVKNLGIYVSDWSKADQLCLPILAEDAFSAV